MSERIAALVTASKASLPACALALAGSAVLFAGEALSSPLSAAAAAWGGAALAAWCAALLAVCVALAGREGAGLAQWKTGPWFLAWCAVADGLASITWARPQSGFVAQILPSSVTRAEWLTSVALTAWAAGYCGAPRRLAVASGARFLRGVSGCRAYTVRSSLTPWLLYGAGTAARLASAGLTGHFGYVGDPAAAVSSAAGYQQVLTLAAIACPLAVAAAALRAYREDAPGARIALAILFAAECVSAAISGYKLGFITAVLAIAIAPVSAGRRMPRGLILAALVFFLVIVIPFTIAYRSEVRGGSADLGPAQAAAVAPALGRSVVSAASPDTISQSLVYLSQRVQDIDAPAIVLQETPTQVPYASLVRLPEEVAAELIPRALWPGKPIADPGYDFSQKYYGTPASDVTSAAITPWADLYQYDGWIPVLAGMFLLGCLMRVVDDVLDARANPHAALLLVLVLPTLAHAEGGFVSTLTVLPGLVLTWLAVTAVTFRRKSARPRDAGAWPT